jgi:hypothetical protein
LDLSLSWGLLAEHKKKDKMLNGKPTFGIVAWSLYTETGLRIDFWPQPGYKGLIIVI